MTKVLKFGPQGNGVIRCKVENGCALWYDTDMFKIITFSFWLKKM